MIYFSEIELGTRNLEKSRLRETAWRGVNAQLIRQRARAVGVRRHVHLEARDNRFKRCHALSNQKEQ